jgi:glycosyltransferase involved in cell wall biosynthesis
MPKVCDSHKNKDLPKISDRYLRVKNYFWNKFNFMLSICVPVYNFDVRQLAGQLSEQGKKAGIPVEILIFDDFSEAGLKTLNREVSSIKPVKYLELPENIGRAAIRNRLAKTAKYPYLLYIDADSLIPDESFIKRYLNNIYNAKIICGGTIYHKEPPENEKLLRWVYGCQREELLPEQRQKKGFSITTNNFMVSRDVMMQYPFRESIREYGHEDTVFGYDLFKSGINILHIENPVIHSGLESSTDYLAKTRVAIKNLLSVSQNLVTDKEFLNHSGLLRLRKKVKSAGLLKVTGWLFQKSEKQLEKHLKGPAPRLWVFDLYKAGYICSLK